jgi:hypothetical protein
LDGADPEGAAKEKRSRWRRLNVAIENDGGAAGFARSSQRRAAGKERLQFLYGFLNDL